MSIVLNELNAANALGINAYSNDVFIIFIVLTNLKYRFLLNFTSYHNDHESYFSYS